MANIAKLNIGEVLQNRKTGEVLTVKELTDTVAVLSNNKGYKLTAILKTYKRATEVITNVNISEAAMEANVQKATATTNTATTTTNTANTLKAVITVQSEVIKEFESKQNFVIKAYNNKKATATATAKTTAKTTATAPSNLVAATRDVVLSIAGEHFTLQQKTTYTSVKFGNKCVMEVYNGKRAFSIAVSNKYLTAEQIALAKVTTQPFPNNCYFKVNSNNYTTILAIVKSAIKNIVTTLNATAKATALSTQQAIIDNDTTAIAEQ